MRMRNGKIIQAIHLPLPQVFTLSRVVRTFGTEGREGARYSSWLKRLTHLSVRQAVAYLLYLTTNSGLYYMTKVRFKSCMCCSVREFFVSSSKS